MKRGFHLCELPYDLPPSPYDYGHPVDLNRSRPSLDARQAPPSPSPSAFAATLEGAFSAQQRTAVDYCMSRASAMWRSSVPVSVRVEFADLGDSLILGTAQPSRSWVVNGFICPVALAEAVIQEDLNAGYEGMARFDILMTLNVQARWYAGTDARTPSRNFDLVTVCLHEIYHGLFMSGGNIGVAVSNASYTGFFLNDGIAGRFDAFMANQDGCDIAAYKDNAAHLGTVLTGNNLWFVARSRRVAKLYAPRPYTPGSSLYHLSEAAHGSDGGGDDLMTPAIGSNYAQHNGGAVMRDIQAAVLDVQGARGADACAEVGEPQVEEGRVEQGSGGADGGAGGADGGGFRVRIGGATVSGWVLVGAAAAALAVGAAACLAARAVRGAGGRKREARKPGRRVGVGEGVRFAEVGNETELV